jgi:hypothetical protein
MTLVNPCSTNCNWQLSRPHLHLYTQHSSGSIELLLQAGGLRHRTDDTLCETRGPPYGPNVRRSKPLCQYCHWWHSRCVVHCTTHLSRHSPINWAANPLASWLRAGCAVHSTQATSAVPRMHTLASLLRCDVHAQPARAWIHTQRRGGHLAAAAPSPVMQGVGCCRSSCPAMQEQQAGAETAPLCRRLAPGHKAQHQVHQLAPSHCPALYHTPQHPVVRSEFLPSRMLLLLPQVLHTPVCCVPSCQAPPVPASCSTGGLQRTNTAPCRPHSLLRACAAHAV